MARLNARSRLRLARIRALKLVRLSRTPEHWAAARAGVVASVEHADVPFRGPVGTVLDVGASRGQFALFALSRFPGAVVQSFEPLPEPRRQLEHVTAGRVDVKPVAVGLVAGRATIHVSAQDDSSSLLPIGRRQTEEYPGTEALTELEVEVTTLAAVLSDGLATPILLKVDVQGLELDVLRGAADRLDLVDQIFVECSFTELYHGQALADEVISFLFERGFRLVGIHSLSRDRAGAALQADLLFVR